MMRSPTRILLFGLALAVAVPAAAQSIPLTSERVASGFDRPVFLTAPPGDPDRLFILEQVSGLIWIVRHGEVLPTPFLDIGDRVNRGGGERGLLGLAFHPDYSVNGRFFVNYTALGLVGDTVIAEYRVSEEDPDRGDPDSERVVLQIDQPQTNHNGGMLAFGPQDGYLYIASGDGGGANDLQNRGQRLDTPLGKVLRIDVDGAAPYAIPADNPFVGETGVREEIWAYGLRNPWRLSFDRGTGDLYIADVGQGSREEVNFQPAASPGGENYGWRIAEGFACRGGSGDCGTDPGFTPPIHDYGRTLGGSVTGGYVYRGQAIPDLRGTYLFGDFLSGRIWSFRYGDGGLTEFRERTEELDPPGLDTIDAIASFGEDGRGELYVVDYDGDIYRIVATVLVGDVNGDGVQDAVDIQLVINIVLGLPGDREAADIDRSGTVDAIDVQLTINAVLGVL